MNALHLRNVRLVLLFAPLAALFLFAPVVDFDFVSDDRKLLVSTAKFRDWGLLWQAVMQPFLDYKSYFRPLPLVTLGLEQILFGGSSFVAHLDGLLLHALNALLVAVLATQVAERLEYAGVRALAIGLLAGAMFALHPAVVETVSWISCRFDLMLTVFALGALIADRALQGRTGLRVAAVSLLFLLAALSKEMALSLAMTLPLWHLLWQPREARLRQLPGTYRAEGHFAVYAGVVAAGIAYLVLRSQAIGHVYAGSTTLFAPGSGEHALAVIKTLGRYLALSAWPFAGLSPVHPYAPPTLADRDVVLGFAALALAATFAVRALRGARDAGLPMLCFLLALLPVINIIPIQLGDNFAHERFLYLPLVYGSIAGALLIGGVTRLPLSGRLRGTIAGLLAVYWLGLSAINVRANLPFWKDNLSLWYWAYQRAPQSRMAQVNLQSAYVNAGLHDQAVELVLEVSRRSGQGLMYEQFESLLLSLSAKGYPLKPLLGTAEAQLQQAEASFDRTSRQDFSGMYNNLGWLYLMGGDYADARRIYGRALAHDARHPGALYGMSVLSEVEGQPEDAQRYRAQWESSAHPVQAQEWRAEYENIVARARKAGEARPSP